MNIDGLCILYIYMYMYKIDMCISGKYVEKDNCFRSYIFKYCFNLGVLI